MRSWARRQPATAAHGATWWVGQISNMPPEWKMLFKQAGIRKRDLHDAETLNVRSGRRGENGRWRPSRHSLAHGRKFFRSFPTRLVRTRGQAPPHRAQQRLARRLALPARQRPRCGPPSPLGRVRRERGPMAATAQQVLLPGPQTPLHRRRRDGVRSRCGRPAVGPLHTGRKLLAMATGRRPGRLPLVRRPRRIPLRRRRRHRRCPRRDQARPQYRSRHHCRLPESRRRRRRRRCQAPRPYLPLGHRGPAPSRTNCCLEVALACGRRRSPGRPRRRRRAGQRATYSLRSQPSTAQSSGAWNVPLSRTTPRFPPSTT